MSFYATTIDKELIILHNFKRQMYYSKCQKAKKIYNEQVIIDFFIANSIKLFLIVLP